MRSRSIPPAILAVGAVAALAACSPKPAPPPAPRPPPSDFCSSTVAISVATIIRWITIATVCISTFRHKPLYAEPGCTGVCGV